CVRYMGSAGRLDVW
nr:immunoglobulin heavy chain junction region [Macaca mulatta]